MSAKRLTPAEACWKWTKNITNETHRLYAMKTDSTSDSSTQTAPSPSKKGAKPAAGGSCRPDSNASDWLAALAVPGGDQKPGPEWKRAPELEDLLSLRRYALQGYLKKGMEAGKVERKMFRVARSDGGSHFLPHYRIAK